jgi:hypothetical protein
MLYPLSYGGSEGLSHSASATIQSETNFRGQWWRSSESS